MRKVPGPTTRESARPDIERPFADLSLRELEFCIFHLARNCKRPKTAAGLANFHGDLRKRSSDLLDRPQVDAFIKKYAPADDVFTVKANRASIQKRLEQMASGIGLSKTTSQEQNAIYLLGRMENLWDKTGAAGRDRLKEFLNVFKSGPVLPVDLRCTECHNFTKAPARFCHCGNQLTLAPETQAEKFAKKKEAVQ
jgi:hypothetical protein